MKVIEPEIPAPIDAKKHIQETFHSIMHCCGWCSLLPIFEGKAAEIRAGTEARIKIDGREC